MHTPKPTDPVPAFDLDKSIADLERQLAAENPALEALLGEELSDATIDSLLRLPITTHATGVTVEDPGPSRHTTIRLAKDVIAACRREAARTGKPYQRLINETLRAASLTWANDSTSRLPAGEVTCVGHTPKQDQ